MQNALKVICILLYSHSAVMHEYFRPVSVIVNDLTPIFVAIYAGNQAKVDFNFNNYSTKNEVLSAVDRIRYLRENTNTTGGLKVTRQEVFGGNYRQRPDVERLIILLTDGEPTKDVDQLDNEVAALKRMGIRIIGLGVTNKVMVDALLLLLHTHYEIVHKVQNR